MQSVKINEKSAALELVKIEIQESGLKNSNFVALVPKIDALLKESNAQVRNSALELLLDAVKARDNG